MLSSVTNSLRVFKGMHDLAFSEDQFYVEQRTEFLGGIRQCIEQAKEGYCDHEQEEVLNSGGFSAFPIRFVNQNMRPAPKPSAIDPYWYKAPQQASLVRAIATSPLPMLGTAERPPTIH